MKEVECSDETQLVADVAADFVSELSKRKRRRKRICQLFIKGIELVMQQFCHSVQGIQPPLIVGYHFLF
jgi:hypothetical protein